MSATSLNLAIVLSLIDQSVDAYRVLLREHPLDWGEEATHRQQEAADLLDRAQTLGGALSDEERRTFTDHFSRAVGRIERLESLRGTYGYDPEEDLEIEAQERLVGEPLIVATLVGGPFHGQSRNLEPLSSDENVNESAPRRIQLPRIDEREVSMVTYLRDSEPTSGEWTYLYVDTLDPSKSL
ncbi:hypothetical protein Q9R19_06380 [Microbacterium sp. ARD32]|uniref:hypothetical protein n=1 Tax=Microbacterium sp. ARD32 TaxID=2962577 RepID=UPI0028812153|nr:hypothetical protein [Microbacterium sp. ARD32]MDT0157250.1 hypothetical protein [Microbacterium sp. ARD32]